MVAAAAVLFELRRDGPEPETVPELRREIFRARAAADSCTAALAEEEARFHEYDARVDSLRAEVDRYESLDSAGVPATEYVDYLEIFDRFNASVVGWQTRADSLRAHLAACAALTERHNTLVDSLRGMVE